jgi:hypothetical protein
MNLNVSQLKSRTPRVPGARPRRPGETHTRLTRVAHHLVDLLGELTPLSPVPFRIERQPKENRMRTEGIRDTHRGTVPNWARSGKEVRHG